MTNPEKSERERLAREIYAARQPKEDWKYEPEDVREMLLITADIVISREKSLQAKLEGVRNLLTELSYAQHNALCRKSKGTRFHFECWACRASKALDEISKEVK